LAKPKPARANCSLGCAGSAGLRVGVVDASVCHSFQIHRTLLRLLVHSYSLAAFISFVGCLPFLVFTFSALDKDRTMPPVAWPHLLRFGGCVLGVGLVISMFWVERARARMLRATQLEQKWRENANRT
jgi:hypothetical protein